MRAVRRYPAALLGCLVIATASVACAGSGGIERWQGLLEDLRFQWSAEAGVDLLGGPAVPVRAFVESFFLSQYAADLAYAYDGFDRAVPDTGSGLWATRPALDVPLNTRLVGDDRYHIRAIEHVGDDVTATICDYRYRVASQTDGTSYRSVAQTGETNARGIYVMKVGLTRPPSPSDRLPPQSGPNPSPSTDVFGEWRVHGMLDFVSKEKDGFAAAWPTYESDLKTCIEKAPDPASVRASIIDGTHSREFFPTAPASPGWPEVSTE